jgi:hypothetical protein
MMNLSAVHREAVVGESNGSALVVNDGAGSCLFKDIADILESKLNDVIHEWFVRVQKEADLTSIPMSFEDRIGHLAPLLRDVIKRLRMDDGTRAPISEAASHHGDLRCKQGYTVAMAVEESRLLEVSIFTILHNNQRHLEFDMVLPAVITIADEVDAQLKQQMLRFIAAEDSAKATQRAQLARIQ